MNTCRSQVHRVVFCNAHRPNDCVHLPAASRPQVTRCVIGTGSGEMTVTRKLGGRTGACIASAMVCLVVFLPWSGCARSRNAALPGHPVPSRLAFDSVMHRFASGDFDSFLVVALARNTSNEPLGMCCRFDFSGDYTPATRCPGSRPPTFFLVSGETLPAPGTPLECRTVVLRPSEAFAESTAFRLYRPDFVPCPGTIRIRASLLAGRPGGSLAETTFFVPDAIEVSTHEP